MNLNYIIDSKPVNNLRLVNLINWSNPDPIINVIIHG